MSDARKGGDHQHGERCHLVYITGNTEYHTQDGICVAVRDLATSQWNEAHPAIGKELVGGLRIAVEGIEPHPQEIKEGDCLCFDGRQSRAPVVTSKVVGRRRPSKKTVLKYKP